MHVPMHVSHTWVIKYNDLVKELELTVQTFCNSGLLAPFLLSPFSVSDHCISKYSFSLKGGIGK